MKSGFLKFSVLFFTLVTSCSHAFSYDRDSSRLSVTLISNQHYQVIEHNQQYGKSKNIAYIDNGDSVNYIIRVDNNYYLSSVDYEKSQIIFIGENRYSLTISEIKYSMRINLFIDSINGDSSNNDSDSSIEDSSIQIEKNVITYDANGGEYITVDGYQINKVVYSTAHHPRPNTSIGANIMKRDGFVLLGWNTKADGSGVNVGLGSRYLDEEHNSFTLFAMWAKYSDVSLFTYEVNDESVSISNYLGNEDFITIPELIENKKVTIIKKEAFLNIKCSTVVLPKTIKTIEEEAFKGCELSSLYFYDNLINVSDKSFIECKNLKTIHINAIEAPRYASSDRHSTYADKIDYLILNKNKKKIVIMGGSGAFYNIDACYMHKHFSAYEACNVAINGWFNAQAQFEIVEHYLGEKDVFLHCVESCGKYQFMSENAMGDYDELTSENDPRFFNCLELNYDLITLFDYQHVTNFFDTYYFYNKARLSIDKTGAYEDYTLFADERGDYSSDPEIRKKTTKPEGPISGEGKIDCDSYNEAGLEELSKYYTAFKNKGVSIYFAYACVNVKSLSAEDMSYENILQYTSGVTSGLPNFVNFVNTLQDVLYPFGWFADTDWHLDYSHALVYTGRICGNMIIR